MRRGAQLASLGLAICCAATAMAQQPPAATDQKKDDDGPVVRIGVTLVQVDAIVTNKDGRPVADLTRDDFEVFQDGQPQKIESFAYVSEPPPVPLREVADGPTPPVRIAPEQVRRTIAIVVDDLKSVEAARRTRDAVRRFVDERMQPGDLIAIVQARAGAGALQQFSGDRQELHAAIERIRYLPRSRSDADCEETSDANQGGARNLDEALNTDIFVRGTLGVLNFVVRGLKELPGRKSVVLLSDGMPCTLEDTDQGATGSTRLRSAVYGLVDLANRASVAIYSIDVRGLETLGVQASDAPRRKLSDFSDIARDQRNRLFHSRDVMSYLSDQTSGLFYYNNNDIAEGIRRAVDDQRGYYLLAYEPDESTFAVKSGVRPFHKLSVRVKRPDVTVRSRTGFYGYPDEQPQPETRSRAQQMVDAVISPFAASGVRMQLTPLFMDDAKTGPVVRCLMHVDARDLTFVQERDGTRKAVVDVVVVAFGDSGGMVSRMADTHEIRVRGDAYELALERGLTRTVALPLKRPGAYQFRAAIRDAASTRIGSAYQFVELPDVSDGEFALSSIVVSSDDVPADPRTLDNKRGGVMAPDPPVSPAVRDFHRGDRVTYGFEIYNAGRDRTTKRPALEISVRVYREGRLFHSSEPTPLDPGPQTDWSHIRINRGLQLGTAMDPGSYVIEVVVTDVTTKRRTASQWIDFDVRG